LKERSVCGRVCHHAANWALGANQTERHHRQGDQLQVWNMRVGVIIG
jgi:hypothetical protein